MPSAALITGGAKRIGRAIALALAEDGYDIALHYNTSAAEAEEAAAGIRALGRQCRTFACNLTDPEAFLPLVPAVVEAMGGLSVLVNNASIFQRVSFLETTPEGFDADFTVNFKAPFFLSQQFARHCRQGHIINLLDTRVASTATAHFAYSLSKKALHAFTRMAARALGPRIRVNAVCPGMILPPPGEDEAWLDRVSRSLPMARHGEPADIVGAVRFLLASSFLTGEAIFVDGGEHVR